MAIPVNQAEYLSRIGLSDLYFALVTQDDSSGYVAGTPEYFAPAAEAGQEPSTSMETQYADDRPFDVMTGEGETKISISVTNLPPAVQAVITGRVFDEASGRLFDNRGEAPWIALGFKSLKSNGSYRWYWYLKGKFSVPKEETATKGDSPDPKTVSLEFTAVYTTYEFDLGAIDDNVKRVFGDSDTTNFDGSTWFTQVQVPGVVAPSALALSDSDPTDGETSVPVSQNLTLTFNNALNAEALSNVFVAKASDGALVSMATGYPSIDSTRKIITFDPASNLTASTAYIISYAVVDIYGQDLQGIVNFTTA